MRAKLQPVSIITILTVAFGASVAHAQQVANAQPEGIEEIVVSATKTGQTLLQDTPLAITAITADQFTESAGRDIRDLQMFASSLTIGQNGGSAETYIRGIGSNATFPGSDSSVALYVDGVYIGRSSSFFQDLFDVDHIEVLRGPQGALYGRNASGGAINIVTHQPSDTLTAEGRVTAGDYNLWGVEGYLSGPIVANKVDVSVEGRYTTRDGYFQNLAPGGVPLNSQNDSSFGSQVKFTPTDNLKVIVRGDYSRSTSTIGSGNKTVNTTTYDPIVNGVLGQPFQIAANTPPLGYARDEGISGEIDYTFSDAAKLTSLSAYRTQYYRSRLDSDFSAGSVRYTDSLYHQNQESQDLNLSGKIGHLTYIAGLAYFEEYVDAVVAVSTFPSSRTIYVPHVTEGSDAGFVQGTYDITSQIDVQAGVRYTFERKTFDQLIGSQTGLTDSAYPPLAPGTYAATPTTYVAKRGDSAWTPKFGIDYRPMKDVLIYGSIAEGFKSGGYSLTSANSFQGYSPEKLWDFELGAKTELDDHHVLLNLTGFHYHYSNLQVQSFLVPGVLDITNAATAHINGIELETQFRPTEGLTFGGALTYLDAKYDNYPNAIGAGNVPYVANGHYLNSAPSLAFNLNAGYERALSADMTGFARLDFMWRGRQYYTALNDLTESQANYGVLNAEAGVNLLNKHIEVEVFARNLANKAYFTTAATIGGVTFGTYAPPRTFGAQITAKY